MTGIQQVELKQAIVHKVGNPSQGDVLKLSKNSLTLNDEVVRNLLTKYFLSAFNENEQYRFSHLSDITLNEVYAYITDTFEQPQHFLQNAALIAQFLHNKSTHSKIKSGEMYLAYFDKVPFENELVEAIGIFKSESKETFLRILPHGQNWEVVAEDGVNINKLDKGCLIFRKQASEGFIVLAIDNTNKQTDAKYWMDDFLQLEPIENNYRYTDNMLSMCKLFISNELNEKFEVNKSDQIDMLNKSIEYFKTHDQFDMDNFAQNIIRQEEVIEAFNEYKNLYSQSKQVALEDSFEIHASAVKSKEKIFKTVLKLDKNFHIYIHGRRDLIERGFDENQSKNYYKLFYDDES